MRRPVHARLLPAVLIAAVALAVAGLVSPATAAGSGTIKGTVMLNGKPISFAKVQIFQFVLDKSNEELEVGPRLKTDNTDSEGRYSFSGLSATSDTKRYAVLVTDRQGKAVKAYRTVLAKSGKKVTQNFTMRAAAVVRGTVTTSDGRSPAGLTVGTEPGLINDFGQSFDILFPQYSTTVKADGTFTLSGIPSGRDYDQIRVTDGRYAQQCYDFVSSTLADCATKRDQAPEYYARQRIVLATGEQRTLPTVTVSKFAPPVTKVTGKVTDPSGKALKGIEVTISSDDAVESAVTRSSGRFTIREGLPARRYIVRYDDLKGMWASQYFGGGPDKKVRTPVTLTPGQPLGGLDTALKSIANAKIAVKGGAGTAKVAFQLTRKVTGSAPSGTLTLSFEGISKRVRVVNGKATAMLKGLPKGTQSLVAMYSGTGSTAGFSKVVKVRVL